MNPKTTLFISILSLVIVHPCLAVENNNEPPQTAKCHKKFQTIFLKNANFKPEQNASPNAFIDNVCNPQSELSPKDYCCSDQEFKELTKQFHHAKKKLTILKNKVVRLFEWIKNLEKTEIQKLIDNVQSIPNGAKLVGPNFPMILNEIQKRSISMVIRDINEFVNWKIDQLGSMACMICSPIHQNFTGEDGEGIFLMINNNLCVSSIQRYGKLDNVAYFLVHLNALVKGILIKENRFVPGELMNLPDLSKWNMLTDKRNRCIDPANNPFENKDCISAIQTASNPMRFGPYRKLGFLIDNAYTELTSFLGPTAELIPEERRSKTLTNEDLQLLDQESIIDQAEWDFVPYKTYFAENKNIYPFVFRVLCSHTGITIDKFKLDLDKVMPPKRTGPLLGNENSSEIDLSENRSISVGILTQFGLAGLLALLVFK